jgi:hypothetical protein
MNISITPESLLQQMAQIQRLERGKLCIIRQGPNGPYYNHQLWENGKNVSRYVPQDQVPALQQAMAGYEQLQTLMDQYVQLMEQKSRAERAAGVKKKTRRQRSS